MSSKENSELGCSIFILLFIGMLTIGGHFIISNVNVETISGKIENTFEKVSGKDTQYIVVINQEPFIVENNVAIGRLDRTTTYAELKNCQDKEIEVTVYGVRIPSISFRGIKNFTPCK